MRNVQFEIFPFLLKEEYKFSSRTVRYLFAAVWRIRDVYPGSRIRLFSIPDPGSELSPYRIADPHKRI
jgi:hypothetical protein